MRRISYRLPLIVLVLDLIVLAVFFYCIPWMRRPFEFLFIATGILGLITAIAVRNNWVRNAAIMVFMLSLAGFGLEMAQKVWNITELFEPPPVQAAGGGEASPYGWNARESSTWLAARARAREELGDSEAFHDAFAGDIFQGRDRGGLWSRRSRGGSKEDVTEALKNPYVEGPPLGFELAPDNLIRHYCRDRESGAMLWDGECAVNAHGFRETRGGGADAETVLFLGCSVTFGYGLSDDQTTAHHFSEAFDFSKRVLNFGVSNYGTHHALRELETNLHAGRAGVNPERVVAVYYGLIDDHANRVMKPASPATPRYRLENGRAVYAGSYDEHFVAGRLAIMLDRSRIYPVLKDKFLRKGDAAGGSYKWQLTQALMAEMDRICRQRYGVGLTVVYWGSDPAVEAGIRANGMELIPVSDALGEDWSRLAILFSLADGHPNAHANRLLGRHLGRLREKAAATTENN